jgi:hypothetical protein
MMTQQGVHDAHIATGDGAYGVFLMVRQTHLAHHKDVQRGLQRPGHFEAHGHAATRQRQHQETFLTAMVHEVRGQHLTGVVTVAIGR